MTEEPRRAHRSKGVEAVPVPTEHRRFVFLNTIDRMTQLGIMSSEYAEQARERVENLEG